MVAATDYDELRIWELTCLPTTTRERTCLRLRPRRRPGNVESIESDSYVLQTSPDHSGRNGRSNSTGRRGVPRGVHRRRGGGYHRVGGPGRGRGVGDPPLRSPPSGSGWGEGGSRPFSSFSVQNIQNTPHMGAFVMVPAARFFAVKTHRSPLKRHSTSREGSRSLRCGRLAARLDDAFLLISASHTATSIWIAIKKSTPPAHCSST